MARIAGVNLPNDKRVQIGLTYVYGLGLSRSNKILEAAGVNSSTRVKDLTAEEENKLRKEIAKYKVEGDLRRSRMTNVKRLKDIECYRGVRHKKRLPLRGQKTRKNSRTVRGNVRKSVGSGRGPAVQKT